MNSETVIKRASQFEQFVISGSQMPAGQTQAWTGDDIMAEGLRRGAEAIKQPAG